MPDFISKQEAVPTHELLKEDQDCVICLTTYGHRMSEGTIEHAVRLACGHVAGSLCLKAWLKKSNQCPFCRKELFPQPHQPDDDSEFREVTIDTAELELRSQFDQHRERTSDEVDELEAKALLSPANRVSRGIAGGENIQLWRGPSLRRRADLHSRELYDQVRAHQIRNGAHPPYTLPILEPWEVNSTLGWKSDLALFKYLQKVGAFRLPGMDLERSALPNPSDESLYNQLRNQGVRWHFDLRGWFQFGRRVTFRGLKPELSNEEKFFDRLKSEGALETIGVTRSILDVRNLKNDAGTGRALTPTPWEVWMQIKRDRMIWCSRDRVWWTSDCTKVAYGDMPSDPELRSEKIWKDGKGRLVCRAGADDDVIQHVENLWLPGIRDS